MGGWVGLSPSLNARRTPHPRPHPSSDAKGPIIWDRGKEWGRKGGRRGLVRIIEATGKGGELDRELLKAMRI